MKKLFQILFLVQISLNAFSQSLKEDLNNILNMINEKTPPDQLFLHLDRNLYFAGDTIWFQAYIRDNQTGVIETQSLSMYVLLVNSNNTTIDSARFRIENTISSGWLKVPESTIDGYYSIVAFTSDQINYDPKFVFNTLVRVGRIRQDRSPETTSSSSVDLRFLPEGGTYIYGVKQRLAFNAVSTKGKTIKVSGDIINQNGKKITKIKSGPYGPGVIEFTPIKGELYYAKPVESEFGNLRWPLPVPQSSGVSLRVENTNQGLLDIILRSNELSDKEYFLTVTMNNIIIFSREIKFDTLFSARINTGENIPSGTAIVTIYDKELNPLAERLIFLNAGEKMKVHIEQSKSKVKPGEESELTINTTDYYGNNISSIISISVIDSTAGYLSCIPYLDIESAFLYTNEFYNNLPQSIKCLGLMNVDNKSLDDLMMTYGWRKYSLKESALINLEKRSDNYDHLKISNPGQEKRGREQINLLSTEDGNYFTLKLNEKRETVLSFDSIDPGVRQIMVLPDNDPSRNLNPITIEFPNNQGYTNSAKLIKIDTSYAFEEFFTTNEQSVFNPDSAIMIESVTIKGHRKQPTVYTAESAQQFKYTGAFTLYSKDFEHAPFFEDIIYKLNPFFVDKKSQLIVLRAISYMPKMKMTGGAGKGYRPALIVVDNIQSHDKSYASIAQLPTSEIASITVIKGPQGYVKYGEDAANGVIIVTTKTGNRINGIANPSEESEPIENHLKEVRLFRSEAEFYIPTKEEVELIPEYQFRPTLFWQGQVYLDGTGPIKFSYPNNMRKGTVMVFVNGVSNTNLIGANRFSYMVKQLW